MKRTTKYINQFRRPTNPAYPSNPNQPDLLDPDAEHIKEYHLKKLRALRDEADGRSKEWIRKQRLTMLGERK